MDNILWRILGHIADWKSGKLNKDQLVDRLIIAIRDMQRL